MIIFAYTFAIVFVALVLILGLGGLLANIADKENDVSIEGAATAAMCTTRLLDRDERSTTADFEDFVIEQDMVYTYDSFNL